MSVVPYLFFDGCCEAAIEFYKAKLGAQVQMLMRYDEAPTGGHAHLPPGSGAKIMHASLTIGTTELMASDGMCTGVAKFDGFSLSFQAPDVASAEATFAALAEGGTVRQPLIETFFSQRFGMLADKFGVGWIIVVAQG